jgi:hypothetical protein
VAELLAISPVRGQELPGLLCVGANSLTYSVQQTSSGWMVGGITASGPVA